MRRARAPSDSPTALADIPAEGLVSWDLSPETCRRSPQWAGTRAHGHARPDSPRDRDRLAASSTFSFRRGRTLARVIRVQGCTIVLCACRNCARFAYACETSMSIWFSMCVSGCVCGVWCVWVCSDWYLPSLRPGASWGSEEQEVAECSSTQFSSA